MDDSAGFADFDFVAVLEREDYLAVHCKSDVVVGVPAFRFELDVELAVVWYNYRSVGKCCRANRRHY